MLCEHKRGAGLTILSASLLIACSTALYMPKESARISREDFRKMESGRVIYINKCSSCHALIPPEKYSSEVWKIRMEGMAREAHLSPEEKELILRYVTKNDSTLFAPPAGQVGSR